MPASCSANRRTMPSSEPPAATGPAIGAEGIVKAFGATQALRGVDFAAESGEVHALVGENGAGKSTLIRILGGIYRPDAGHVIAAGERRHFANPHKLSPPAS